MSDRYLSVELSGLSLVRDGRRVLRDIDWRIHPGQRWLLTGSNGSGKTLLMKLIAGDVWPSSGHRRFQQHGERFDEPFGIKEEIAYLGAERQDRYERYGWNATVERVVGTGLHRTDLPLDPLSRADRSRVRTLLAQLGLAPLAGRPFLTLSYGERRLALLARALAWSPKLLLLDELLTGLDGEHRAQAIDCLSRLARSALPWVLSSHHPEELTALATHRCHLAAGRMVDCGRLVPGKGAAGTSHASFRRRVRRAAQVPRGSLSGPPLPRTSAPAAPALIRLKRASVWREGAAVLRGVSMTVHAGDCWVVHGPNGSGKSSLLATLHGDLGIGYGGSVERAGIAPGVPLEAFRRRVGLVTPELQTGFPRDLTVTEVVASGRMARVGSPRLGASGAVAGPKRARVPAAIRRALAQVGAAALAERALRSLSYGQVRRVLFARALIGRPDILLLDEPYAGLDPPTRSRLQAVVDRTTAAGTTVVIASHHSEEWPRAASHELELAGGTVRYAGPARR